MNASDIVDAFWAAELRNGYDAAVELICKRFGVSKAYLDSALVEDDELNNGNC